jgi:thioesterase domain-containing protein
MFKIVKLCVPKASGRPLYCAPTAAGSVDSYFHAARIIGLDRPVYGIVSNDPNWSKFGSLKELVEPAAKLLKAHCSNDSAFLFGYSFGGKFAIEIARQLAAHGIAVPLVAIADQAPYTSSFTIGFRIRHFAETFGPWIYRVTSKYVRHATLRPKYHNEILRNLRGQHVFENESWYQGLPEWRKNYISQNLANSRKYRFEGVYRGQILLLRALQGQAAHPFRPRHLEDYGWGRLTGATVDVRSIPGTHASIMQHPDVAFLGDTVRKALNDCDDRALVERANLPLRQFIHLDNDK